MMPSARNCRNAMRIRLLKTGADCPCEDATWRKIEDRGSGSWQRPGYTSHLFGVPTWSAAAESLGAPAPRDGDAAFPQRAESHPARRKSGVDVLHSQARFGLCHRTPSQQPSLFCLPARRSACLFCRYRCEAQRGQRPGLVYFAPLGLLGQRLVIEAVHVVGEPESTEPHRELCCQLLRN